MTPQWSYVVHSVFLGLPRQSLLIDTFHRLTTVVLRTFYSVSLVRATSGTGHDGNQRLRNKV
jgi:hypothetical protein